MRRRAFTKLARALAIGALASLACVRGPSDSAPPTGFVLISLSGLRADSVGFQGKHPTPSPFLDSLAERSHIYERAFTTSPETLAAHTSLLSGRYPIEHQVVPPGGTLSAEVAVLPEIFSDYGYRTAGFTDGGYLSSDYGFDRGFDEFAVSRRSAKSPLVRAARFLGRVGHERFFLFVHSDAIEKALLSRFDLRRLASGSEPLTPELTEQLEAEYLDAVSRLDRELAVFFERVEELGLLERTVIAVTADHGFELGEHGRVGHRQVYPETLGVPLLLLGPNLEPARHDTAAQIVDIAPSLYALARMEAPGLSGIALPGLPSLGNRSVSRSWVFASAAGRWEQETLLLDQDGRTVQIVRSRLRGEHDGTWVTRSATFESRARELDLSIVSFGESRTIRLVSAGRVEAEFEIGTDWTDLSFELPGPRERRRFTLATPECSVPSDLGAGPDRRCLSFKVRGVGFSKTELFDLSADPGAANDRSLEESELAGRMRRRVDEAVWTRLGPPAVTSPRPATLADITIRGEYPEPPHP